MDTAPKRTDRDDSDDANAVGHRWLEDRLLDGGRVSLDKIEAIRLVESQPATLQISILKACVERLPALRENWSDREVYAVGEQLYLIASRLYGMGLPLEERDICSLLHTSRHGCGHGTDVAAPLDLAVTFMSNHDASPDLLVSIATYIEALKGVNSAQAKNVKRRASILSLLDHEHVLNRKRKAYWSQSFTSDLAAMDGDERRAWQSLVLSFKLNDRSELPRTWQKVATSFTTERGLDNVLRRIAGWWPREDEPCKLDTGCSHLLKHFVWLIETVDADSELKPQCDQLVCSLATIEWKPMPPAAKVIGAAAHYLAKLPPELGWDPLERLGEIESARSDKIRQLIIEYAASHGLKSRAANRPGSESQIEPASQKGRWAFWK